jgi:hypothetical protein
MATAVTEVANELKKIADEMALLAERPTSCVGKVRSLCLR